MAAEWQEVWNHIVGVKQTCQVLIYLDPADQHKHTNSYLRSNVQRFSTLFFFFTHNSDYRTSVKCFTPTVMQEGIQRSGYISGFKLFENIKDDGSALYLTHEH